MVESALVELAVGPSLADDEDGDADDDDDADNGPLAKPSVMAGNNTGQGLGQNIQMCNNVEYTV